jgi:hypothetical protein
MICQPVGRVGLRRVWAMTAVAQSPKLAAAKSEGKTMNKVAAGAAALGLLLLAGAARGEPLRAGHPLIGTWKLDLPDQKCQETYRIQADGTMRIRSAEEEAESVLVISDQPSAQGFYKWVDKVTQDNGKKDCSGEATQVGRETTNYIRLHPSGDLFLMCEKEDINTCMGPLVRQKDGG